MSDRADRDLLPLYVRLYFDEDVSVDIVRNLRQRGFDVLSTHEARRLQRDDDAQLEFAVAERRALVTHNRRDFELRHEQCLEHGRTHYGIIIARRRASDGAVVTRLLAVLNSESVEGMINQLRYI